MSWITVKTEPKFITSTGGTGQPVVFHHGWPAIEAATINTDLLAFFKS